MDEEKAREVAIQILDEFEELLDGHNITIPSEDRKGRPEEAHLYGEEYRRIEDAIVGILVDEMRAKEGASRSKANGVNDDARRACDAMRRKMAKTPEGFAARHLAKAKHPETRPGPPMRPGHQGQGRYRKWK